MLVVARKPLPCTGPARLPTWREDLCTDYGQTHYFETNLRDYA